MAADLELLAKALAAGGDAIARDGDGRVVFVEGALPGERVRVEVVEERKDFARARVVEVVDAAPQRIAPPCASVDLGCGGCQWQHVDPAAQLGLKAEIVLDALRRIARVEAPEPALVPLAETAQRTTLRMAVAAGRAAFRRRHSHDVVPVDDCAVAHPLLTELLDIGRFGNAPEVVLRAGAATGDRLVMTLPCATPVEVPSAVVVVGEQEARAGADAHITEVVGGRCYRVSALSFFQSGLQAASALAAAVADAVRDAIPPGGTLVDLYAGVGLLGGAAMAASSAGRLVAVESSRFAVADARQNLSDVGADVVRSEVGRWRPTSADVVVADPARSGLGRPGVTAVVGTGAPHAVLVSCDPASFARDTRLLADAGYALRWLSVVDCFPATAHVETVAGYTTHSD